MAIPKGKHYEQAQAGRLKFQRFQTIERAKEITENEERTVQVIFSSDEWVPMWYGDEKLEHGRENVDLSYFNARMSPLLIDHRYASDNQVGVVEEARISGNKGYATIRFGRGPKAEEYYRDVLDGIRSCLSVGYEVGKWEIDESDDRNPKYTATEWTPREISLVTFPADDSVGVIRSERQDFMFELQPEKEEEEMLVRDQLGQETSEEVPTPSEPETPAPETPEQRSEPEAGEQGTPPSGDGGGSPETGQQQQRSQTQVTGGEGSGDYAVDATRIIELTTELKQPIDKAYRAIEKKQSFAQYEAEVRAAIASEVIIDPEKGEATANLNDRNQYEGVDVEPKDKQAFRLTHLIAGKLDDFQGTVGGFEKEICDAEEQKRSEAGMTTQGLAIPGSIIGTAAEYQQRDAIRREMQQRQIIAGTDASGGFLVDDELRPENFIDILYGEFAVSRASTMLMDVKGDIVIPKQDGRISATWNTETSAATESNPTFEQITLTPKRLTTFSRFSRTFAIQSSLDAENLARRNIMREFGAALDQALIYGTGSSNQIAGVTTINRIDASPHAGRITYTKANLTYANCLSGIEILGNQNIPMMGIEWMASWKFWKDAKQKAMLENGSYPIWHENMICDFPANVTSQIKQGSQSAFGTSTARVNADHAFVGNWMYLLVAMWGGMDIIVDQYTNAHQNMVRVIGHYRVDCDFAYDEAFVGYERAA